MSSTEEIEKALPAVLRRVTLLAFSAGYVDAFGFLAFGGIHPAAMTGNTVQLTAAMTTGRWAAIATVGVALSTFFCGGLFAHYARRKWPNRQWELLVLAAFLAAGQTIWSVRSDPVAVELPLLTIAMAIQGAAISRMSGSPLQTIVMTTNLLKLADGLVSWCIRRGQDANHVVMATPTPSSYDVMVPASAWGGFILGATFGTIATAHCVLPLLVPIALVGVLAIDLYWCAGQ